MFGFVLTTALSTGSAHSAPQLNFIDDQPTEADAVTEVNASLNSSDGSDLGTLTFEVRSSDSTVATGEVGSITKDGSIYRYILTISAGAAGTATLTVEVTDSSNNVDTRTLTVWVAPSTLGGSIVVQPTTLPTISEGRKRDISVKLSRQPRRDVTVSLTSGDTNVASVGTDKLDFTTTNWSVNQTVSIFGIVDADNENDTTTVTLSGSGGGYTGVSKSVAVSVEELPGAPISPSIRPGNGRVTLAWTAPSVGGTPHSWAYRHRVAGSSNTWPLWRNMLCNGVRCPGGTTEFVVSDGVNNDTTYEFQVAALNQSGGVGSASPILTAKLDLKPTRFAVAAGDRRAALSWDALTGVSGWQYRQKAGSGTYGEWTDITGSGSTTDSHAVTGLTAGSSYTFQIRATLAGGAFGAASDELSVTPVNNLAPSFGQASVAEQNYQQHSPITPLVLPAATGGDGTLSYALTPELPTGLSLDTAARTITGTPTSEAQDATTYSWTATDTHGDAASLQFTISVDGAISPPTGLVATPDDAQVFLNWDLHPQLSSTDIFFLRYKKGSTGEDLDDGDGRTSTTLSGDTTSFTASGLDNGDQYVFGLVAYDADGTETYSRYVYVLATPQETPVKPSGVVATPSYAKIRLSWNAIADVSSWEYRQGHSGGAFSDWIAVPSSDDTTTQHDVTGLTNGTAYDFQLRAVRGGIDGLVSDTVTSTPNIILPNAPTGLVAVAGEGSVALSWQPPTNTIVEKQQVRWKPSHLLPFTANDSWTDVAAVDGRVVTGLANGILYRFEVRAESVSGTGQSTGVFAVPTVIAPSKPWGLSAVAGDGTVSLSWLAVASATAWQYQQKQGDGEFGAWTDIAGSEAATTSHELTGLTNGTTYGFRVRAMRSGVSGPPSDSVEATPAAVPTPMGFFANKSEAMPDVVDLRWTSAANPAITKWQYQVAEEDDPFGSAWTDIPNSGATTRAYSVSDLAIETKYRFRVRAVVGTTPQDPSDEDDETPKALEGWFNFKTAGCSATLPDKPDDITMSRDSAPVEIPIALFADDCKPMRGHTDGDNSDWPRTWGISTEWGEGTAILEFPGQTYRTSKVPGGRLRISPFTYRYGQIRMRVSPGTAAGTTVVVITLDDHRLSGEDPGQSVDLRDGFEVTLVGNPLFAADAEIPDQHYAKDSAISPPTLPAATGGNGKLTYTVSPALPAGLVFDGNGTDDLGLDSGVPPTLSGTPTAIQSWTTHTMTVHDSDSDRSDADDDTIDFRLRVNAPPTVDNGVDDQRVVVGATQTIELASTSSPVFGDPNTDEVLRIVAVSNVSGQDNPPFTMTRSGDTLTLRGERAGSGTVTLYATDLGGEVATDSFAVEGVATPGPVTDLVAVPGHGLVALTWKLPNSGSAPTAVQIRHRVKSETDWPGWTDLAADAESRTITGLTNGVEYSFEVRTSNEAGQSAAASTDAAPLARPEKPVLAAVAGDGKVTLSWTDPENTSITKYQLQQKEGDAAYGAWAEIAGSNATTVRHEVTGLTNETTYGFKIRAVNASGEGAASDEVLATPQAPRVVTLVVDPLSISENGGVATVTATLDKASSVATTVEVSVSPADGDDYSLSDETLTIAAGSTTSEGSATITGVNNEVDAPDKTVTVSGMASNSVGVTDPQDVSLTIEDDDRAALSVPSDPVDVTEGDADGTAFTVKLATEPTEDVTVSLSSKDTSIATVSPGSVTLTSSNWRNGLSVTVTAANDDDGVNETVKVDLAAVGGEYEGLAGEVTVNVTDDDTPALSVPSDPVDVTEGDADGTSFTVKLAAEPTEDVTVSLTSKDTSIATVSPGSVTLTSSNWRNGLSVTVTAANDDDGVNETVKVDLAAAGGEYEGLAGEVTVNVTDDDTPALTIAPASLALTEGHAVDKEKTFTVALATEPTAEVTVGLTTSGDTDAATVSPTSLTFTTANWKTAQTVTVTALDDDDASGESVTVALAASGGDYALVTGAVAVTVTDDDTPALTVSPTDPMSLTEGGVDDKTDSFTVSLATEPTATVTVSVTSGDTGAVTVDKDSLTFTTADWNTAQTVTVTAADDLDGVDETVKVALGASGGEFQGLAGEVTVNVTDDDTPALTVSPTDPLSLTEGGVDDKTDSFTVSLATEPTATVTVSVTSGDTGAVTVDKDSLTFTTADWNTAQTVTVTAADDLDGVDETVKVALGASGGEFQGLAGEVTVNVTDDDTPALAVSPTDPLSLTEGHAVDKEKTFTVALATQPTATVTVGVTNPNTDALTVDATSLSFTTTNWSTAQTVKVTAKDDVDGEDESLTIGLGASGGDYAGLTGSVLVDVTDDDIPTVTLVLTPLSIDEGPPDSSNRTATVTATLDLASSKDTTIKIEATPGQNATSDDFNLSDDRVLTIKAGETASTGTAVTITSVDNNVDSLNKKVIVSAEEATNSKGVKPPQDVSLTIIDDDATPTVELKLKDTSISEGGTTEVWAELSHASGATTTLTLSTSGDNVDLSDSVGENNTLTIAAGSTTSNRLTITPDPDTKDEPDKTVTILATVSNDQNGLDAPRIPTSLSLTITDDDAKPTLEIALDLVKISENGGVATVTAKLLNNRTSSEDTTIEIGATPGLNATSGDFNLSDNNVLTIKKGETASTGTAVTITGVDNNIDAPDKTVTVSVTTVTNSHQAPDAPTTPLTLTIENDDVKPSKPLDFVAKADDTKITLEWKDPEDATITRYQLQTKEGSKAFGAWTDIPGSGASTVSHEVNDLTNGMEYTFKIRAVSAAGDGDESDAVSATPRPPLPAAVTGLNAVAGDGEITLSWINPNDPRITKYEIRYEKGAPSKLTTPWKDIEGSNPDTTSHVVTGLQNGAEYGFEVRAVTTIGPGEEADARASPQAGPQTAKRIEITKSVFAEVGRVTLADAVDMISERFRSASDETSLTLAGQEVLDSPARSDSASEFAGRYPADFWHLADFSDDSTGSDNTADLRDSEFTLSLDGRAFGSGGKWVVWGRGDTSSFRGRKERESWTGDNRMVWFGGDYRKDERWLAGMALSRSKAKVDYQIEDSKGRLESTLTTVWPYLQLTTENATSMHLIVGIGDGGVTRLHGDADPDRADLTMKTASVGFSRPFMKWGSLALSATGDGGLANIETGVFSRTADGRIRANAWRVRGGLEAVHDGILPSWSNWLLTSHGAVRLRQDGGDGIVGTGLEMQGGVRILPLESRLSIEASGNWLVMHSAEDTREWGASVGARLDPESDGSGVSLSLEQRWGEQQSDALTGEDIFDFGLTSIAETQPTALTARAGYGFREANSLMTPFLEIQLTEDSSKAQTYRTGVNFRIADDFAAELVGEYDTVTGGSHETRALFNLRMQF